MDQPRAAQGIAQAVARLRHATATGVPCAPVRDLIGSADVAAAYAVQMRIAELRCNSGARVVGRKVGLTSPAVQAQLGVEQPDFGVLFDDMAYANGDIVPMARLLQPKVEVEVAFTLGADLAAGQLDVEQIRDAILHCCAAIEIVDSRIADWDITFGDTVADNGSSALFVLGSTTRTLGEIEPASVEMTLTRDGALVSSGDGAACMGDPINALAWLAWTSREFGQPLHSGEIILSGALGPMVTAAGGETYVGVVSGLGTVSVSFDQGGAIS